MEVDNEVWYKSLEKGFANQALVNELLVNKFDLAMIKSESGTAKFTYKQKVDNNHKLYLEMIKKGAIDYDGTLIDIISTKSLCNIEIKTFGKMVLSIPIKNHNLNRYRKSLIILVCFDGNIIKKILMSTFKNLKWKYNIDVARAKEMNMSGPGAMYEFTPENSIVFYHYEDEKMFPRVDFYNNRITMKESARHKLYTYLNKNKGELYESN